MALCVLGVPLAPLRPLAAQGGPLGPCTGLVITTTEPTATRTQFTGPYAVGFTVTNCGTTSIGEIDLTCEATGAVTCVAVSPVSGGPLAGGASFQDTLTYTVGAAGTGVASLRADYSGNLTAYGTQYVTVSGPPLISLAVPVLTSGSRAVVRNRTPVVRATFLPQASPLDTTKTRLVWRSDTVSKWTSDSLRVARQNRGLVEWEVDSVRGLNASPGDSALITVKACAQNGLCSTVTRWAVLPADSTAAIGFQGIPFEAQGATFRAPFGPGLQVTGGEVETGLAIPSYISMGRARAAGLVYSTRQSYPRALVPVDVELRWPTTSPDSLTVRLKDGLNVLDMVRDTTGACLTGSARRCRMVLQGFLPADTIPIPAPTRKWLTVEATVALGGSSKLSVDSVEVVLVDRRASRYGAGWWPAGVFQLSQAGDDRLLIGPDGTATVYRGNGDSLYLPPPGSFVGLTRVGSEWWLRARGDSAVTVFDSLGRLRAAIDQNLNRDSIRYSGTTDQVTAFRDPAGQVTTLHYDGNGALADFTDPGNRVSTVTMTAQGELITFTPAGPRGQFVQRFGYQTYPGPGTRVLSWRAGNLGDTTRVTYDSTFRRRPVAVTLPRVDDESGTPVTPVIGYTAVERQGAGVPRAQDSVYVQLTDPRGFWTRSRLTRWGQASETWDAIGLMSRSNFGPDGALRWTEGKNGDSSRVYTAYDSLARPARSFIVRGPSDVLRLDSLVYDSHHRVIRRVDARNKVWTTDYDGAGNVIRTIAPNSPLPDTTRYWYRSDGLLDSMRLPADSVSSRYYYHGGWKNLLMQMDPSRDTVLFITLDYLGRTVMTDQKVRVQATGTSTEWQWRRRETYFTPANLVDSTRLIRTDNCAAPCTTPSWPPNLDTDSVHVERVRFAYDTAGRDSLRRNDRNVATRVTWDRLGRLRTRTPFLPLPTIVDSLWYDVAGNLARTRTRRGDVITSQFDSRNRDTLTVIPGVGTRRQRFAGPQDQRTRLWLSGMVDSIGQVDSMVRWGYDSRGRLRADTVYTRLTARVTTYAYDTYERVSGTTDPLGTWGIRYETQRGMVDSLTTPYSDTVSYSYDQKGRMSGPTVRNGGAILATSIAWNATNEPQSLTTTAQVGTAYTLGKQGQESPLQSSGPMLKPVWTEQHSAGGAVDSLKDVVLYDGWERLDEWIALKGTTTVASESYEYDRVGNVRSFTEPATFDTITTQLLRRVATAGRAWKYSYDPAGNLIQAVDSGATSVTYTYGYDALNQLRSVRRNAVLMARYAYDALGRRLAKRVYSTASGGTLGYTRFVYRGGAVGFESDSLGSAITWRYTWGLGTDQLVAFRDGSGNHYYPARDKLGSVRAVMTKAGIWKMSLRYTAWGVRLDSTGVGVALRYRWAGREWDPETGWYYLRARYYDPKAKRFTQEDPVGEGGGGNRYGYVAGRVLEARDPSGLGPEPKVNAWPVGCCIPSGWDGWFGLGGFIFRDITYVLIDGVVVLTLPGHISNYRQLLGAGGKIVFRGPSSDQDACMGNTWCREVWTVVDHLSAEVVVAESSWDMSATSIRKDFWSVTYGNADLRAEIAGGLYRSGVLTQPVLDATIALTHELAHVMFSFLPRADMEVEAYSMYFENLARGTNPGFYGTRCGYRFVGDYGVLSPSC